MVKMSVIVPVYNVEEYLPECLDSLISQTLSDIEIICVNDGSTDNSLEILKKYGQKDSRIKVVSQVNAGVSEARNTAIKAVTGEYVAMVDPDDWLEKDMLEKLYLEAVKKNADIVECDFYEHRELCVDNLKIRRLKPKINFLTDLKIKRGILYSWRDIKKKILSIRAYVWNKIYRTDLIKNQIWFEGRLGEDYYFVVEAFLKANKIVYYNKPLYHYRKRNMSLSATTQKLQNVEFSQEYLYSDCKRMEDLIIRCNLMGELKQNFDDFVIKCLWRKYKSLSIDIRRELGLMLDEENFTKLETVIQNKGKSFLQTVLSVSTEIVAGITYKKLTIFGYSFLYKVSH